MRTKSALYFASFLVLFGCKSMSKAHSNLRDDQNMPAASSAFDQMLGEMGLEVRMANLHAHHYMGINGKNKPVKLTPADEGRRCDAKRFGGFAQDDGSACREDASGQNSFVVLPNAIDYVKDACDYARDTGGLDILLITPHSKNNQKEANGQKSSNLATDSDEQSFLDRQKVLADFNASQNGKFYCGLGQEASSISTGNHINIFGHFRNTVVDTKPIFFPAGRFDLLYPQTKARIEAGDKLMLQLNHADVEGDQWWGSVAQLRQNSKNFKTRLNDYGLDDYSPVGCIRRGTPSPSGDGNGPSDCSADMGDQITLADLRKTYAHIREASGDPFRFIETVSPNGAASNASVNFRSAKAKPSANAGAAAGGEDQENDGQPDTGDVSKGLYDYLFYLAMGFKIGPAANQDNHYMNFGTASDSRTGVLTASLKEDDIFSALNNRKTFATETRRAKIFLGANLNDGKRAMMGDSVTTSGASIELLIGYKDDQGEAATFKAFVYAQDDADLNFRFRDKPEAYLRIHDFTKDVGNADQADQYMAAQTSVFSPQLNSGEVKKVKLPLKDGGQYVLIEVTQSSGARLWSAPIWISREAAPAQIDVPAGNPAGDPAGEFEIP